MFGGQTNKPFTGFGQTNTGFGGTTFGGTGTNTFGAKTGTGAFGTPGGFGTQTPASGGLFGGTNTSTTAGGLFGGSGSTGFGQTNQNTGFSFGGNTNQSGGGLFGGNTAQSSIFATPTSSSAFGAKTPAGTGFGNPSQPGGLFGSTTQQTSSLFGGGGNPSNAGIFGGGGNTGAFGQAGPTGTTVKFNPPGGTDTMLKGGVSTNISTRHQCITAMKEYENKSLEELRLDDYGANRKGPQQQTGLFGGGTQTSQSTAFGGFSQNKPTGFAAAFGANTSSSTGSNLFGQNQNQGTNLFGGAATPNKSLFGTPATSASTTSGFGGFGQNTATSLFGQQNQQPNKGLFGTATTQSGSGGLFGTNTATSTGFGTSGGFGFGNNQTSGGLFGNKPTGFGQPTSNAGFGFGQQNTAGGGLFSKPATSTSSFGFGQNTGIGFGTNQGTGLFGNKPGGFGATTAGLGTGFGLGTGLNTGTSSLFSGQQNKPTLGLGTGFATGTNFGGLGGTGTTTGLNLGAGTTQLGSSTDASAVAAQQAQIQHQLMALANSPYGDSPLFRNLKQDEKKRDEVLKPTNPAAQKAALNTSSQYKVSSGPTAKIKPKALQSLVNGKAQLFQGLEDDDATFGNDTFVPRKSIKKLVIRKRSPGHSSSASQSQSQIAEDRASPAPPALEITNGAEDSVVDAVNDDAQEDHADDAVEIIRGSKASVLIGQSPATGLQNLDDTIAHLKSRSRVPTGEGSCESTPLSRRDDTQDEDQRSSRSATPPPHPAGIKLVRPGYYTIPSLEELATMVDNNGECIIEDFLVGREGYGNVFFPGKTNITDMDLDEIVHFRRKEVTLYPDDEAKPPIGDGLNKKAQVTLDCVWPKDKSLHSPVKSPERLAAMKYQDRIEAATAKIGATFIDYRADTGSWVFEVKHFSKYGLVDDSDDEDVLESDPKKLHLLKDQNMQQLAVQKQKVKQVQQPANELQKLHDLQEKLEKEGVTKEGAQEEAVMMSEEDSEMADPVDQDHGFPEGSMYTEESEEMKGAEVEDEHIPSSHRLASSMGVNAHNMQVMKASFFAQEDDMETEVVLRPQRPSLMQMGTKGASRPPSPLTRQTQEVHESQRKPLFGSALKPQFVSPAKLASSHHRSMLDDRPALPAGLFPPQSAPMSVRPFLPTSPQHLILPSGMAPEKPRQLVGIRRKQEIIPLERSLVHKKQSMIMDAALFHGRSFRVGWSTNWALAHFGKSIEKQTEEAKGVKTYCLLPGSEQMRRLDGTPYNIVLEKVQIGAQAATAEPSVLESTEKFLEVQLDHSEFSTETPCPIFVPKPGVEALHQYAKQAETDRENMGVRLDGHNVLHQSYVWDLAVALWGKIPGFEEEDLGPGSYVSHMERREAFSRWLASTASRKIRQEVEEAKLKKDGHLNAVLSHLSGRQISEACRVAQEHRDHRLALMVAQAAGTAEPRQMLAKQLSDWEQLKADHFVDHERMKIFSLLAGMMVWQASDSIAGEPVIINVCENMDWKRCLALHLWYQCSPTDTIADALRRYDQAYQGKNAHGKYTPPPLPPYIEEDLEAVSGLEDDSDDNQYVIRDTCYHLLKLYSDRTHQLERVLAPTTSTPNHLDYRLSWHLLQALQSLGFHHLSDYQTTALHTNFVAQLESSDLWHWAIFVALHITEDRMREKLVKELLSRHVCLSTDEQYLEKEEFVQEKLHVPKKWIHEAKAQWAHHTNRYHEEAWHLLQSAHWNQGHLVVLRHIAADAIISGDYAYLKRYLHEMEPLERSNAILEWNTGGKVFLDYINMNDTIEEIKRGEVGPYELERLQPEVTSLCDRIDSLKCLNAKDRLCQSEMAKRTANLMKTLLLLQDHGIQTERQNYVPSRLLAPHIGRLPMPEDYVLQELRELNRNYMMEMTMG